VYGTDLFADMHDQQLQEFVILRRGPAPGGPDQVGHDDRGAATGLDRQVGVVAPGALADLLVIDGNPLDDIRVLTTPEAALKLIMKKGQVYKNEL